MKKRVYSGTAWEGKAAYSRAARNGNSVAVSGTVSVNEKGEIVGRGDLHAQAGFIFKKIEKALKECGASLKDVIRTRAYMTDMARFDEFARAHKEAFEGIDPATSCIGVSALVDPGFLIEIEVDAVL